LVRPTTKKHSLRRAAPLLLTTTTRLSIYFSSATVRESHHPPCVVIALPTVWMFVQPTPLFLPHGHFINRDARMNIAFHCATRARTHAHTHTRAHTHAHTHTHTHTRLQVAPAQVFPAKQTAKWPQPTFKPLLRATTCRRMEWAASVFSIRAHARGALPHSPL
jgi:hypothetical protein